MMERWSGRVALVTGAAGGMGQAMTRRLVHHGVKVIACDKVIDKLKVLESELSGEKGSVIPIQCDLRSEPQIMEMFAEIERRCEGGGVDLLINNAGLAFDSWIIEGDSEPWRIMWEVQVLALCLCTREAVKSMRARSVDDGYIINIGSTSGHRVGKAHMYSATKYAVRAITDGIKWELRDIKSNIRITLITPASLRSGFHEAWFGSAEKAQQFYANNLTLEGSDIADAMEYILSTPSRVQVQELIVRPADQTP